VHGVPPDYFLKRLIFLPKVSCRKSGSRSRDRGSTCLGIKAKRAIIFDESGRTVGDIGLIAAITVAGPKIKLPVMRSDQSKNAA
jgi:hypothetical protein